MLGFAAHAQVTFKITAVPATTPANATIYMAGTFNGWNPASAAHTLTRNADGSYEITLPTGTGTIEYKFTRGAWASVETTVSNGQVPNRTFTFGSSAGPVLHQILNWEDVAGGTPSGQSTAAANVSVISTTFEMPQLGRTRRVWLYLPPGYATSGRRYPVLYMQNGQNVFDKLTAFAGEWGVDEALNLLNTNGQDPTGCIVVAVDNGGASRLNEYSPWNNPQNGGGQGDLYLDFLVQTLKPYIDTNYRTLANRENTGIAGSSMGALIATYAALRHPAVFGKVGVFSPAYWFAAQPLFAYVHQHPANPNTRFYFVSGTGESTTMVPLHDRHARFAAARRRPGRQPELQPARRRPARRMVLAARIPGGLHLAFCARRRYAGPPKPATAGQRVPQSSRAGAADSPACFPCRRLARNYRCARPDGAANRRAQRRRREPARPGSGALSVADNGRRRSQGSEIRKRITSDRDIAGLQPNFPPYLCLAKGPNAQPLLLWRIPQPPKLPSRP
ncbi:hypothetical protein BEN47_12870 [Hymenobacter lapidarius]|uniref:CBM20 domain-containing protein n=1 Tax=Hymenobacter lapidarius TaxID=1908237 RepID=A0A1G1T6N2_9BACT|nr:hypothetical protein BEN47_12870 [Hymenobacter lapidarius]